ncbi:MAG: hypothetical protein KF774_09575 [Planctomyces sp.]|nr:hypothetical protein [Planctomyces sp.]
MSGRPNSGEDPHAVFSTRVAVAVSAVAAVSFIVMLILIGRGDNARRSLAYGPSGFSMSALGYSGVVDFLRDSGLSVRMRRSRRAVNADRDTAVVLAEPDLDGFREMAIKLDMPGFDTEEGAGDVVDPMENARRLRDRARDLDARFVVVLAKWRGRPLLNPGLGWVHQAELLEQEKCTAPLDVVSDLPIRLNRRPGSTYQTFPVATPWGSREVQLASAQWLSNDPLLEPIVSGPEGVLIGRVRPPGRRELYVISDPDILSNHGLARADHAEVLLKFLTETLSVDDVLMDEVCHGLQQETPFLAEFVRLPLGYASLHGLLLLGVCFWAGFVRFGSALPAVPRLTGGQNTLVENTAQLLSYRARFRFSAERYFDGIVAEVAEAYHVHSSGEARLSELQRLSTARKVNVSLERWEQTLRLGGGRRRTQELLEAACELHRWREGMLHGR